MFRRRRRQPEDNTPPVDMTPMIDCIFLLLIFFILTSKFVPDDQQIGSLHAASGPTRVAPPLPKPKIVMTLYPDGFSSEAGEGELQRAAAAWRAAGGTGPAWLRVGGSDPIRIDPVLFSRHAEPAAQAAALTRLHAAVAAELERREVPVAQRTDAPAIEVHAFSGLPWGCVLTTFDAVRAFEAAHGAPVPETKEQIALAREVNFAGPRVRRFSTLEDGKELYEVMRMR